MSIFVTSDLHFNHDKPFLYQPRGYKNIQEMNEDLLKKFNITVSDEDEVWICGDLTLGDLESAKYYLERLQGHIHVILGNHDTDNRRIFYESLGWDCQYATIIKYHKWRFYLSHYPTIVSNYNEDINHLWCLHGHLHEKSCWGNFPNCYNVCVDAHQGYPINLDTIIQEIKNKQENNK
jgi:calcineurin-like phosphoesterase family protein